MPSPSRLDARSRTHVRAAALCLVLLTATACGGGGDPGTSADPTGTAPGASSGAPSTPGGPTVPPAGSSEQPPLPPDPSGYTEEYVQATLSALFVDYQAAVVAYQASGEIDDTVRVALANVYHPDVYDQQIRNLEDYFPGGENLEDPPGPVVVQVTGIHSVSADCILALTTYDASAVTTLEAPAEEDFFIGLARNDTDPDGTHPWLITVEYTTSDGQPLPADACS